MTRFIFLALVLLGAGCGTSTQPLVAVTAPIEVTTSVAAVQPIRETFEAGGIVTARTTATIASRIVATVVSVNVTPGDTVRAGQRLIVLDSRDLNSYRHQATASVTALQRSATVAEAERDAAAATLTLARATHDRMAALHARKAATPHELDEAVAALRGAEARLRASEARAAEVDAALESAGAAANGAAVAASFAVLTAPFQGVVTEKLIEPGNLATVGAPLLRIDDTRSFRLEVRIDESRAADVTVGAQVTVLLGGSRASTSPNELAGHVTEIARAMDAASHAFLVKIELPAHPGLRSGMFARARFGSDPHQALTVPGSAIVRQGQLSTLFVISDGHARMRVVRTGETDDGRVEIVAGVAPGEHVIVSPPPSLRDGDPIRAASADGSPAQGEQ